MTNKHQGWQPQDTYRKDGPQCPYCGHVHDHDGGYFYDDRLTVFQCECCDEMVGVSVYTSTSWTCELPPPPEQEGGL